MRVLWITNGPLKEQCRLFGLPTLESGGWMEAAFNDCKKSQNLNLAIASVANCKAMLKGESKGVIYYVAPNDLSHGLYKYKKLKNINLWKRIITDFNPDVIHVWGTEMAHPLCALIAAEDIPSIIYIQGVMSQIIAHAKTAINPYDLIRYSSLGDVIRFLGNGQKKSFELRRLAVEREILSRSKNVFVESEWCANNCRAIVPDCRIFKTLLPINSDFANVDWDYNRIERYSVFTVAGRRPVKGIHNLIQALAIVKRYFPDIKLYVPGSNPMHDSSWRERILSTSYIKYLRHFISQNNLNDNIIFTGRLSSEEMAKRMSVCNLFVMPSAIENHSSTLIEAMMVGAPCISSYVGGISDYLKDGENGIFYRYDEPSTLAGLIIDLLNDSRKIQSLSQHAKSSTRTCRLGLDIESDFMSAYEAINAENRRAALSPIDKQ